MEETVIEIPEAGEEEGWQPPVLTHRKPDKLPKKRSCSDVFFIQYVICILLVTAFFAIRLYDKSLGDSVLEEFRVHTHTADAPFVGWLAAFFQNQWN